MGLLQLGCLAWIHLTLALTVSGLSRTELFDYGVQYGDQPLEPGSDQTEELALDQTLFFYKDSFDSVYINTNGFVALAEVPEESEYLGKMPAAFGVLAALLGNLDTSDGVGKVYYRQDSSPSVLLRAAEHIGQAFPADDEVEPKHVVIVTWENVVAQGVPGRGDGIESNQRNTFQLVVASMESASYAILLYPQDGLQFHSTPIEGESKPLEVGFSQGQVAGWFWNTNQGDYYRVTTDDEVSIQELTKKTNSGRRGVWVYEIGTSPFFTSIHSGEVEHLSPEESVPGVVVPDTPERGPQYPPVNPPYETVTDAYDEYEDETPESPFPPVPPTRAQPVYPVQFPVYPEPADSKPVYPEPKQPEPRRPQVVVVDADDLDVDVFSYNYETCANNWQKCSSFADCRDYSGGYCCHCRPGYYGDGRDCVAEGKPQRMNGKVTGRVFVGGSPSPLEFASNELHSYVVANDGRAYVAISTIPAGLGPSLQPLASLGGAIGWAFALEQPDYENGFSLIGGRFTRQAEVTFHPGGERLSITQVFKGIDEHDHLTISTQLEGRVPEVPRGATVQIEPYSEIYQYSRNVITSSSRRDYTVSLAEGGIQTLSYSWRQTISFESCQHDAGVRPPTPSSQQLTVDQVFVMYDAANQLIRYAMSNKIGSIHSETVENPCFTGRHGCDTNAMCRPGEGTQFTCECASGFTGDGRACYDIDECRETPQICGRHAICSNQPGTFRCECMDGFQFASDGRTCVEVEQAVNHCLRGTHDCDLAERARCSYSGGSNYICSCLPGYQGDGRSCRDIDECQPGRCHRDAICYNTQGSYTCQCRPGFYGDGFQCTPESEREKTACERHRERAQTASANTGGYFFFRPRPAVGQFVPSCDQYGAYEPMQCHGSLGQCWCVDREGQEITGTRTGPGSRPSCIDQGVPPTPVGPTPRPDVSPLTPGTSLLFAQSGKIEHVPLNGESMLKDEAKTLLHVPDKVVIALAYDCVDKMVYWSDITQPAISRVPVQGGQPSTLVTADLGSPEGIAIDHLSRLMFWTDSMMDRIEVSKLDGSHRRVLFDEDLVNPRPIVADPINGRLYWSDWNRDGPKVEMANMDGTDRSALVSVDLGLPNGLTFDPQTRQLCWADAGTRKVECIDPYTRQRRKIVEGIQYPFAVVHYGSNLFYTDWRREAVVAVDRRSEKEVDFFLPLRRSRTYGITTTHPQCLPGANYCSGNNGGCSHLCLPRPGGRTCGCPDNAREEGTCVQRQHP
ncbi:nidogen-1-like isoform X1 [Alosa sapidissima]|uniref:nidogen-1-like isoform X1 n=1 Tax=Alosa sapidissima TaxID=34773 RepID=UPI001C09CD0E|nr:nidogen-1-like isoform X1 [Alosa sapidissima]